MVQEATFPADYTLLFGILAPLCKVCASGVHTGPASLLLEKARPYRGPALQQVQTSTPQIKVLRPAPPPSLKIGLHLPRLPEDHPEIVCAGTA